MNFGHQLEHFSLRWNNFNDNMKSGFHDLLKTEDFVDVTIAAEGKLIQAHKMVLSVCSPYFKNIFKTNPCQHPVIFLKDVTHKELSGILQFMYLGEVSIQQEELGRFLKTAEALQIKGLTGDHKNCNDDELTETQENHKPPVGNKTKLVNDYEKETCVKKMKLSSFSDLDKKSNEVSVQSPSETVEENKNHVSVFHKTEEIEFTDEENDRISLKEESMSDSFLQLAESMSDVKNDIVESSNNQNLSGPPTDVISGIHGLSNEPFVMTDSSQEIRFVMSPRMRPCLLYNNYLYIKDHVGVASPGQPRTIYWRCKETKCKARCIQTDFKFRLKKKCYHQHRPNIDLRCYSPIYVDRAYDVIKLLGLRYYPLLTKNQGLCPICGRILQHKKNLQTHISDQHSGILRSWSCNICHKVCKTWSALRVHTNRHHTKLGSARLVVHPLN